MGESVQKRVAGCIMTLIGILGLILAQTVHISGLILTLFPIVVMLIRCCMDLRVKDEKPDHPETQSLIEPDTLITQLRNFLEDVVVTGKIKDVLNTEVLFGRRPWPCKRRYGFKVSRFVGLTWLSELEMVHKKINPDNFEGIATNLISRWEELVKLPPSQVVIIRQAKPDLLRQIQSFAIPLDATALNINQNLTSEEDSDTE